ncbi:MAG: hypothetical protein R2695_01020 [Acidimicrobiales bacterium]
MAIGTAGRDRDGDSDDDSPASDDGDVESVSFEAAFDEELAGEYGDLGPGTPRRSAAVVAAGAGAGAAAAGADPRSTFRFAASPSADSPTPGPASRRSTRPGRRLVP